MKSSVKLISIILIVLFAFACSKEGTIEVHNCTGGTITSTIDGEEQVLNNFETQSKDIEWSGTDDEKSITLTAQAAFLGFSYASKTKVVTVIDGETTKMTWY